MKESTETTSIYPNPLPPENNLFIQAGRKFFIPAVFHVECGIQQNNIFHRKNISDFYQKYWVTFDFVWQKMEEEV